MKAFFGVQGTRTKLLSHYQGYSPGSRNHLNDVTIFRVDSLLRAGRDPSEILFFPFFLKHECFLPLVPVATQAVLDSLSPVA